MYTHHSNEEFEFCLIIEKNVKENFLNGKYKLMVYKLTITNYKLAMLNFKNLLFLCIYFQVTTLSYTFCSTFAYTSMSNVK